MSPSPKFRSRSRRARSTLGVGPDPVTPRRRFLASDDYRVEREWKRYEGTPQRDLFRSLRARFLERYSASGGWTLEVGPGPGRFSRLLGGPESQPVLLDLSIRMLARARKQWREEVYPAEPAAFVRGDAVRLPFRERKFSVITLLGNTLGFALNNAEEILDSVASSIAKNGNLLIEIAPGSGERSRYLHRLPPGAVRRLFRSSLPAIYGRVMQEGFVVLPPRGGSKVGFRRMSAAELARLLRERGFSIRETIAVAPSLGAEPERIEAVAGDPISWGRLVELEEELGRNSERFPAAAALLVAACLANENARIK